MPAAYPAIPGEWMPARLGKAWPPRGGNGRVMIYLAFGLENDFLRYRIAVVCQKEDASSGFSRYRDSHKRAVRYEGAYRNVRRAANRDKARARELVARDHFISREDGTANLTECPTRRGFIALLIESD